MPSDAAGGDASAEKKAEGNAAFKAGNYSEAVAFYTEALALLAEPASARAGAALQSNRSAALLALGEHRRAERDGVAAAERDPTFVKAFYRISKARLALGDFRGAREAVAGGLRLDVGNSQLAGVLGEVKAGVAAAAAAKVQAERVASTQLGDLKRGEYSGTLRWNAATKFMELPPAQRGEFAAALLVGWENYVGFRLEEDAEGKLVVEPSFLDGASYALSLVYALQQIQLPRRGCRELHVVLAGAAAKSEERVLRETAYFGEVAVLLPATVAVTLHFVGPEISESMGSGDALRVAEGCTARLYRSGIGDFIRQNAALFDPAASTVSVTFNGGFGSGNDSLAKEFVGDVCDLVDTGIPCVFTQANDYSDLAGETAIMRALGAKYILAPQGNPFQAVSCFVQGTDRERQCRGQAFMYAVRGCDRAGPRPAVGELMKAAKRAQI